MILVGKTLILLPENNMLSTQNEHCKLFMPHALFLLYTEATLFTPIPLLRWGFLKEQRSLNSCSGAMEIEQAYQSRQGLLHVGLPAETTV
jgi:hypothetical protein